MTDIDSLSVGLTVSIVIACIVTYALFRKQATARSAKSTSRSDKHWPDSSQDNNYKRLFEEHLKTFEQDYLAYLLEKEVLRRRLPLVTLEALAQQYGASKGDPPYTPYLDLPKKGMPSATVSKLLTDWLTTNEDTPTDDPLSFRVWSVIKARLERKVAEICDKAAQTH